MASITWPPGLPQNAQQDGYSERPPDTTVRSDVSVGPPKLRRRQTNTSYPVSARYIMTDSEVSTLRDFYVNTAANGSKKFDWPNPRTGNTVEAVFTGPPSWTPRNSGLYYTVSVELEVLP
jgi:hypothetical protein